MPFFLSSKPPGKSAAPRPKLVVQDKTKAKAAQPSPYGPALLWLCLGLGVGASLGTGWYFARQALRAQVALRTPVPSGKNSVVLNVQPWISPTDARNLVEGLENCLNKDPLDGDCLAKVADSLACYPAIGHVHRVWRETDGRVHCLVDWYAPAGIVVGHAGTTLSVVDIQGHLLTESLTEEAAKNFQSLYPVPRIEGVATPAQDGGKPWDDRNLQAGLKVLDRLSATVDPHRVLVLRVGELDANQRPNLSFVLQTAHGPLDILWGLPVGGEAGVDAPVQDKLKALRILDTDPSVRSGQAGSHFSIRHGKVLVTEIPPPPPAVAPQKAGSGRKP